MVQSLVFLHRQQLEQIVPWIALLCLGLRRILLALFRVILLLWKRILLFNLGQDVDLQLIQHDGHIWQFFLLLLDDTRLEARDLAPFEPTVAGGIHVVVPVLLRVVESDIRGAIDTFFFFANTSRVLIDVEVVGSPPEKRLLITGNRTTS